MHDELIVRLPSTDEGETGSEFSVPMQPPYHYGDGASPSLWWQ
jgi:hypothetical protein